MIHFALFSNLFIQQGLPEVLHFPDTCGLKFQCKMFLGKGDLGKFGSTYVVESLVMQDTGIICYKAVGEYMLKSNEPLKSKLHLATNSKYVNDTIYSNGE